MEYLIHRVFESEFREDNYKELVLNLFNHFDFSKEHTLKHQFNDAERRALNDFTYFGTYEDAEKKCLDVLTVELKSSSKVERARSLQRNLIGKYLKTNLKDSALVAFYSKDNPDWRLSFVKMDYRLDERGVKVEIGTPPKRYSFLVGKTEPSHTAQKQLMPLLDDRKVPILDEIEKSFSIEKVTKEFYTEIAKKFTELVGGERKIGSKKIVEAGQLKYPKPSDTLRKEFAVRLIGRLMFCWFLKKKKSEGGVPLIPNVLLSSDAISQYPDYYHSLLEPLFFQVLNTPIEKRNKSVRHSFWNNVPFLNGGLFEPHLYDYYEIYYESGFSKYINTLKVPDSWFLDLFKIFEIYNFTIDESTSIDIDISVDPEMLGRIFENLLAEINPQTGETARKSTGSYYTPRPIVEYMVDESLKQYLKTQLTTSENVIPTKVGIQTSARHSEQSEESLDSRLHGNDDIDDKISRLLSYGDWEIDLTESEKDSIIDALDRAKIIDPACGSGAFPMGILHKMLLILQKIDPESKQWLSRKLARIDNDILRKEAEKKLKTENWDYIHKLGIIQNSIYGVDIQPIAVEISKLRFFLSLIVDEKIDDDKPNRGVVPLPNLEFKFVAANSLIGLPKAEGGLAESHADIEKLRELRDAYFTAYGDEKRRIEHEFKETQNRMFQHALNWQATGSQTYKLSEWNPFVDEASSWFDPEWMFGVKDGFDITIGNPPYVRADAGEEHLSLRKRIIESGQYETLWEKWDLFIPFIELGYKLLRVNGITTMIVSDAYCHSKYAQKSQNWFLQNSRILRLDFLSKIKVFEASVHNIVYFFQKRDGTRNEPERRVHEDEFGRVEYLPTDEQKNLDYRAFFPENNVNKYSKKPTIVLENICYVCVGMVVNAHEKLAPGAFDMDDLVVDIKDQIHPKAFVEGKHLDRWVPVTNKYLEWGTKRAPALFRRPTFPELYEIDEKILVQRSPGPDPKACYDNKHLYFSESSVGFILWHDLSGVRNNSLKKVARYKDEKPPRPDLPKREDLENTSSRFEIKYLLGVMNSSIARSYLRANRRSNIHIYPDDWKKLPIPNVPMEKQAPIVSLVDQIIAAKQNDPDAGISLLERQIDKLVYDLYDLTPEEPEEIEIEEGQRNTLKGLDSNGIRHN
jgi:hypothetical protein